MQWFEGDISQAITLSKQKNATFVVFVYGDDTGSTATMEAINSPEVSDKLNSNDFVAIKLESGSQPYHQFVQIYQLVPVPSLFFIGQSGVPLDVVPGEASIQVLMQHINKVSEGSLEEASCSSPVVKEQSPSPRDAMVAPGIPPAREATPPAAAEDSDDGATESMQERIKRAEQIRLAVAAKKQREDQEREREREQVRRREGQLVAEAKRAREALEAQQALDERRRDRELEREAKERVLKKIEEDKRERAAKFAAEKSVSPPPVSASVAAPSVPATAARLQFRLPDGSSHTHVFEPTDTLGEVRSYVKSSVYSSRFTLSMAFPRAELASEDDNTSLQDLGLVPSAALLVLPPTSSSVSAPGTGIFAMLWMLLSPFTLMWGFISSRIWGSSDDAPPPQEGPTPAGAAAQARAANQNELKHRVRREGNVHRLAGSQDSDDENNTYNGNSTQQM